MSSTYFQSFIFPLILINFTLYCYTSFNLFPYLLPFYLPTILYLIIFLPLSIPLPLILITLLPICFFFFLNVILSLSLSLSFNPYFSLTKYIITLSPFSFSFDRFFNSFLHLYFRLISFCVL